MSKMKEHMLSLVEFNDDGYDEWVKEEQRKDQEYQMEDNVVPIRRILVWQGPMDHRSVHYCNICRKDTIQETVNDEHYTCQSCGVTLMHTDLGTVAKATTGWTK